MSINAFKIDSNLLIAYRHEYSLFNKDNESLKLSLILNKTKTEIYYATGDSLFSAFEKLLSDCVKVTDKCKQFLEDIENNNYKIEKTNNSGWFPNKDEADENLLSSLFNFLQKDPELVLIYDEKIYDEKNKYYLAAIEEKDKSMEEKMVITSDYNLPSISLNDITLPDTTSRHKNLLKINPLCETLFLSIGSKSKEETLNYLKDSIFKLGAYMEKIEKKAYELSLGAEDCQDKIILNEINEINIMGCYANMFKNCTLLRKTP